MSAERDALANLALALPEVPNNRKITLVDQDTKLILARRDLPGSLYDTLRDIRNREIAYAEITHSLNPLPGCPNDLEIQRFEFVRKDDQRPIPSDRIDLPLATRRLVSDTMHQRYPQFDFREFNALFALLWENNPDYVRISPSERIARIMWLYQQTCRNSGLFFDVEAVEEPDQCKESRVLLGVAKPPRKEFLTQVMEVFRRLDVGVRRSYSLTLEMEDCPYFLGTFYVKSHNGRLIRPGSDLYYTLQKELYNTQILCNQGPAYAVFLEDDILSGEEASLAEALSTFAYTTLSHGQPDRFDLETVKGAFYSHPDMVLMLVNLFRLRFDPELENRDELYKNALASAHKTVREYNTGQRYLDGIRRTIFTTGLMLIEYSLKTNFFVPEKHALVFRLDPSYLKALDAGVTDDLPRAEPYRISFFYGRHGYGYHIGFSDIARGGWRTIVCRNQDEYVTNSNNLFREVFVLAHTQHLKNKDIYEGGSKMTVILDARDLESSDAVTQRLHKLQYGFTHAFLDVFVTQEGRAKHPRVMDYYRQEEPIELGPDENLQDSMIELIARLSVERGYVLGMGLISSKRIGINHKAYGVTSRGVFKAAEIALKEAGIDAGRDHFTVKMTGGPFGDVAGNSIRLFLKHCPRVGINTIIDGGGALFDPSGADADELESLIGASDVDRFSPDRLHSGGFILYRNERRWDDMRELYRKCRRTAAGVEEQWITADEFYAEVERLTFEAPADLFLPCGGRPETIDASNWERLFPKEDQPSVRVIVEGANSFITPEARTRIQQGGVIVLRDATANKCGVISSSYEIIANLLMGPDEFLEHKEAYVADVIAILNQRAQEEASLIFRRHRESEGRLLYTDISAAIGEEINRHYAVLFDFFQQNGGLAAEPMFERVIFRHLPAFVRDWVVCRERVKDLPPKIKYAILASEIASSIVYHGGWEGNFEKRLRDFVSGGMIGMSDD